MTSQKKAKITVVTALTGKRDKLWIPEKQEEVDYVCFSDEPFTDAVWEYRKACDKFDTYLNAKIHKILIHKYIKTEYSVWIDASVEINKNIVRVLESVLKDKDIAVYNHSSWNRPEPVGTIEDEIRACIELKKDHADRIMEQYKEHTYPKKIPPVCTIIFRRHTKKMERLNEKWWSEICRYSVRDQLSFPYVFKDYHEIGGMIKEDFNIKPHL